MFARTTSVIRTPEFQQEMYCINDKDDNWINNVTDNDYKNTTISIWYASKLVNNSSDRCIISIGESSTKKVELVINEDDVKAYLNFSAHGSGGTDNTLTKTACLAVETWVHITLTYSGSDSVGKLYINGVLEASDTSAVLGYSGDSTTLGLNSFLHVNKGYENTDRENRDARWGDLAIYDRVLTAREVKRIYNNKKPFDHKNSLMKKNLKAWYRFGNGIDRMAYPGALMSPMIFYNQLKPIKRTTIFEDDFSANINGWETSLGSGDAAYTISHSTDIAGPDGSSGVMKCVAGTNASTNRLFEMSGDVSGIQSLKVYIVSCQFYYKSSPTQRSGNWAMVHDDCDPATRNGEGKDRLYGMSDTTLHNSGGLDKWQRIEMIFCPNTDTNISFYINNTQNNSISGSALDDGCIVYMTDFKIEELDAEGCMITNNKSNHGKTQAQLSQGKQYRRMIGNSYSVKTREMTGVI